MVIYIIQQQPKCLQTRCFFHTVASSLLTVKQLSVCAASISQYHSSTIIFLHPLEFLSYSRLYSPIWPYSFKTLHIGCLHVYVLHGRKHAQFFHPRGSDTLAGISVPLSHYPQFCLSCCPEKLHCPVPLETLGVTTVCLIVKYIK